MPQLCQGRFILHRAPGAAEDLCWHHLLSPQAPPLGCWDCVWVLEADLWAAFPHSQHEEAQAGTQQGRECSRSTRACLVGSELVLGEPSSCSGTVMGSASLTGGSESLKPATCRGERFILCSIVSDGSVLWNWSLSRAHSSHLEQPVLPALPVLLQPRAAGSSHTLPAAHPPCVGS